MPNQQFYGVKNERQGFIMVYYHQHSIWWPQQYDSWGLCGHDFPIGWNNLGLCIPVVEGYNNAQWKTHMTSCCSMLVNCLWPKPLFFENVCSYHFWFRCFLTFTSNMLYQFGGFIKFLATPSSHPFQFHSDFPSKKPSSFWGTPMTMETSICQGHHESSASIDPVGYPTSWKPSESSMAVDFSFVWVTRDHFTNKKWAGFCVCVWKMLVSTGDGKITYLLGKH